MQENKLSDLTFNKHRNSLIILFSLYGGFLASILFLMGIAFSVWTGIDCSELNKYNKVDVKIININKVRLMDRFNYNFLMFSKDYYNITHTCYTFECTNKYDKYKVNDTITLYEYKNNYIFNKNIESCYTLILSIIIGFVFPVVIIVITIFVVFMIFFLFNRLIINPISEQ
jgi:hypothetical protein